METNGVKSVQKTAADYKPESLQNAKEEEVKNTIFDLQENINNDMANNILADGKVNNEEKVQIGNWIKLIDNMLGSISSQVQEKLADLMVSLEDLAANLFMEINDTKYDGKNIELEKENDEIFITRKTTVTDNSEAETELYEDRMLKQLSYDEVAATANSLRIPDRKFSSFTNFQQSIMNEYKACIDSKNLTNGRIAANLKNFQAKYEEELKQIAASVSDDGIYEIDNLYTQLSSQIRFHSELARRDTEKNNEEALNLKYNVPRRPSAEQAQAHGNAMQEALNEQRKKEQADINEMIYGE